MHLSNVHWNKLFLTELRISKTQNTVFYVDSLFVFFHHFDIQEEAMKISNKCEENILKPSL